MFVVGLVLSFSYFFFLLSLVICYFSIRFKMAHLEEKPDTFIKSNYKTTMSKRERKDHALHEAEKTTHHLTLE